MFQRSHTEGKSLPQSTTAEITKVEGEIVKLKRILNSTPPENKRLLSDTREAIRDAELRLKTHRQNVANSPEAILQRKVADLAAAKAELARVEKHHPTEKRLLSSARSAVWDLEAEISDRRKQLTA